MSISYKQKFEQLQQQLLSTYETYYLWKSLQKEEYNDTYRINNTFWSVTLPSLQHEWFMGLARAFEDTKYTKIGNVISVYSLVKEHPNPTRAQEAEKFLSKNKKILTNIERVRDHVHAHNNAGFLLDPKEFEKKFPITYPELEGVFEFTNQLLGLLHPEEDNGYSLDHIKEEAERDTQDILKGIQYYNLKRNEHLANWMENGGNPEFPE